MGQKTNSNILQLSVNKKKPWNSVFFEKNNQSDSNIIFQIKEIKLFLHHFFKHYGLLIHSIKIKYTNETLDLYISFYISYKSVRLIRNQNKSLRRKLKLKRKKIKKKKIKKKVRKSMFHRYKRTFIKRMKNKYKYFLNNRTVKQIPFYNFSEYLLESLYLYNNKTKNIKITLQNLNKGLSVRLNKSEANYFKRSIVLNLRKFSKAKFFKESLNILTISAIKKNSAKFLAEYIASQLKFKKQNNFFLKFIRKALKLLINSSFLKTIKGIKIELNGRVHGRRRSITRTINIGRVSRHLFKNNLDYHQSIAYTKNGTFGVKIWINETKN